MNNQPTPPMLQTPPPAQPVNGQPPAPQTGQPFPAPMPGAPMQSMQPPMMPGQMPKRGMSKGLLWGIIGGSIALVLLIVSIVVAVILLSGPSKQDYKDAAKMMSDFKYSDNLEKGISKTKDASQVKKAIEGALTEADAHFNKLEKTKAMRDPEVKKLYQEYRSEYNKAKQLLQRFVNVYPDYVSSIEVCNGTSVGYVSYFDKTGAQAGEEFDKSIADCSKVLNKMKNSDDSDTKKYAETMISYYNSLREYYVTMANIYSSKDYTTKLPKYPNLPDVKDPVSSVTDDLDKYGLSNKEQDLYNLLLKKAKE
ncbi:hypothetical protein HG436_002410 [Candidatus Saccharibacteria bacterium]|nr:hypothetical protein [Candidatus Saccharibacteria bacterium]